MFGKVSPLALLVLTWNCELMSCNLCVRSTQVTAYVELSKSLTFKGPYQLGCCLEAGIHYTTFAPISPDLQSKLVAKNQSQSADLSWQIS